MHYTVKLCCTLHHQEQSRGLSTSSKITENWQKITISKTRFFQSPGPWCPKGWGGGFFPLASREPKDWPKDNEYGLTTYMGSFDKNLWVVKKKNLQKILEQYSHSLNLFLVFANPLRPENLKICFLALASQVLIWGQNFWHTPLNNTKLFCFVTLFSDELYGHHWPIGILPKSHFFNLRAPRAGPKRIPKEVSKLMFCIFPKCQLIIESLTLEKFCVNCIFLKSPTPWLIGLTHPNHDQDAKCQVRNPQHPPKPQIRT